MITVLYTLAVSATLALVLGFLLGFFKKVFFVEVDPKIMLIRDSLPGANCGGCGYPGCDAFAEAVAAGEANPSGCTAGGKETADKVCAIMGVSADALETVAVLACQGSKDHAVAKGNYTGVSTCRSALIGTNGIKVCEWACQGFGDCVTVCLFDAIHMGDDGLPHVDETKCTGCGMCIIECPQKLLVHFNKTDKGAFARCNNRNKMIPQILKSCSVGCFKCGKCVRACKYDAIHLVDGIPVVDYEKCTSCNDCVEACPTNVLYLR